MGNCTMQQSPPDGYLNEIAWDIEANRYMGHSGGNNRKKIGTDGDR